MIPRVILHSVVSIDGRMDGFDPDMGLFYSLVPRWREGATLVGADTLLATGETDPEEDGEPFPLPTADSADRRPLLIVTDSRGRVRNWRAMLGAPLWRAGISLCTEATPSDHLAYLSKVGVEPMIVGEERVDLRSALCQIRKRYHVETVRVDSGGTLSGALLSQGLVHEVSVLIHPSLVGGNSPKSIFIRPDRPAGEPGIACRLIHCEAISGDHVWLIYEIVQ